MRNTAFFTGQHIIYTMRIVFTSVCTMVYTYAMCMPCRAVLCNVVRNAEQLRCCVDGNAAAVYHHGNGTAWRCGDRFRTAEVGTEARGSVRVGHRGSGAGLVPRQRCQLWECAAGIGSTLTAEQKQKGSSVWQTSAL